MLKRLPLTFSLLYFAIIIGFIQKAKAQANGNDLGITFSALPQSGCNLNTSNLLTVTVNNYGNIAQSNYLVSFRDSSGPWTPVMVILPLQPNDSITYPFSHLLNFPGPGTYMIIAKIENLNAPDPNPSNDADTIFVTNSNMPPGKVNLNFETPVSGAGVLRKVTNPNSAIIQTTAASNGANSLQGLLMDGVNSSNWTTPGATTNVWTSNPDHFSGVYFCFTPDSGKPNDTLLLSFDLKQLYKTSHLNTSFRVTVNGQQVGPTYNPPAGGYGGAAAPWNRIEVDFSTFLASGNTFEIGLESSVKEGYDNGNGTANLIDNLEVERISARMGTTGIKENALQSQLSVYPNPSNGIFNVALPQGKAFQLEITDLTGKTILKTEGKNQQAQLKLQGKAKGIYILKITSEGQIATRKLIVE